MNLLLFKDPSVLKVAQRLYAEQTLDNKSFSGVRSKPIELTGSLSIDFSWLWIRHLASIWTASLSVTHPSNRRRWSLVNMQEPPGRKGDLPIVSAESFRVID